MGDQGLGKRLILKGTLQKLGVKMWTGFNLG